MARSYKDVETARIATDAGIWAAAEAALALLAADGAASDGTGDGGERVWRLERSGASGVRLLLSCTGPSLPATVPAETIRPADIAKDRPFIARWRLVVKAPILVLDLAWQADKPLRVMTFANGDWQQELARLSPRPGI